MAVLNLRPLPKQHEAYQALSVQNKIHKYIIFGGAAGGGKSWLGAEWLLSMCIRFPQTSYFIGRNELSRLMKSSFITFGKVTRFHNLPEETWKLNAQYNIIKFPNGSYIDLLDLAKNPQDALYERFGSLEYTAGWIEEGGEVDFDAFDVLKSRIGRNNVIKQGGKEYRIPSKMLVTCNPKKNWLYTTYYKPYVSGTLPTNSIFIPASYEDNVYTAEEYGENLSEIRDPIKRARLKDGCWEYEETATALLSYEDILSLFVNNSANDPYQKLLDEKEISAVPKFIVVDVARKGKDLTTIYLWEGLQIKKVITEEVSDLSDLRDTIMDIANKHLISKENIIVDEDGVGCVMPETLVMCEDEWVSAQVLYHKFRSSKRPVLIQGYSNFEKLTSIRKIYRATTITALLSNGQVAQFSRGHFLPVRYPNSSNPKEWKIESWDRVTKSTEPVQLYSSSSMEPVEIVTSSTVVNEDQVVYSIEMAGDEKLFLNKFKKTGAPFWSHNGGLKDQLKCRGFINNNSCYQPREAKRDKTAKLNYANLKTQCAFKLQELMQKRQLTACVPQVLKFKDIIIEELEQLRETDDDEKKIKLVPKKDIKKNIGRSPDHLDNFIMRMFFEVEKLYVEGENRTEPASALKTYVQKVKDMVQSR